MFSKILGQKRATSILENIIERGRVPQSYFFYGPKGTGKFMTALNFAMSINCESKNPPCGVCNSCRKFSNLSHPDFLYIYPSPNLKLSPEGNIGESKYSKEIEAFLENKINIPYEDFIFSAQSQIRIDAVHMLQNRINISSNEAKYKVAIIEDCDQMNIYATNGFLKTLEEPPPDTVIILITTKIHTLLSTIVSRCQKIPFLSVPQKFVEEILMKGCDISPVESKIYARIADGNVERALYMANNSENKEREISMNLISFALKKEDLKFLDYFSKYKFSKDKNEMGNIISYLIIWLSDIYMFAEDQEKILNIDKTEMIEDFYNRGEDLQIPDIIEFLEEIKLYMKNNVSSNLLINGIYAKISSYMS